MRKIISYMKNMYGLKSVNGCAYFQYSDFYIPQFRICENCSHYDYNNKNKRHYCNINCKHFSLITDKNYFKK